MFETKIKPSNSKRIIYCFVIIVVTYLTMIISNANMGKGPDPKVGDFALNSPLKNISVLEEELYIDLSGLSDNKPVEIIAKYSFECSEDIKSPDLFFVANNLKDNNYQVKLDNSLVSGTIKELNEIPRKWLPPKHIPWIYKEIEYNYSKNGFISLQIENIAKGKHFLEVKYYAQASESFEAEVTKLRSFVYILKPSEEWNSFNNFQLKVLIPKKWDFSSNLDLNELSPKVYTGKWSNLPDDFISIVTWRTAKNIDMYSILFYLITWVIFIVITISWMYIVIRFRIKNNKSMALEILNSLFVSFVASVYFFLIYFIEKDFRNSILDYQLDPYVTWGIGYTILFFPIVLVLIGIVGFVVEYLIIQKVRKDLAKKE